MAAKNTNLPFFLSLNEDTLQVVGGVFEQEGFKIESFAQASLPLDVVSQGEITNPKKLAGMLTSLLASSQPNKIKTRLCYVSLFDDFVFSKYLSLPLVGEKELEAAVYFKIKDFLPQKMEEMYLDWQQIIDHNQVTEINVVAVKRKIIDSFLHTLSLVNVFPLGFEPESCSLARLSALFSLDPTLVIYFNTHRIIFCFVEKGVVLLTRAINYFSSQESCTEVKAEISKLAKFWQTAFGGQKKIKNVFLAGVCQNELVIKQTVKDNFNLELKKIPLPIIIPANFSKQKAEKLSPIFGLTYSQKAGPQIIKPITLIPAQLKKARNQFIFQKKVKNILKFTHLSLWLFIAVYLFIFLSLFFKLEITKAALSGWEKTVVTPSQMQLEKNAVSFNQKIISLDQVLRQKKSASPQLAKFIAQVPAGIMITELKYNLDKEIIEIKGTASSRENIMTLEKALTQFGKVTIPLSSFEEILSPKFSAQIKLKSSTQ